MRCSLITETQSFDGTGGVDRSFSFKFNGLIRGESGVARCVGSGCASTVAHQGRPVPARTLLLAGREGVASDVMIKWQTACVAAIVCASLGAAALRALAGSEPNQQQPTRLLSNTSPPAVVTLEGAAESEQTFVRLRNFAATGPLRELGQVHHAPHSGRKGALWSQHGRTIVLVNAAIRPPAHSTYDTALFAVENGQTRTLIADGISNNSAPLITERGTVLVQRGTAGTDPDQGDQEPLRVLRLRIDDLTIEAVSVDGTQPRVVFRGPGQYAHLACALRDEHFLLYHVTDQGAYLRDVDAQGLEPPRVVLGPIAALARDFSFDRLRDEVTFAQPTAVGSLRYEIVTVGLRTGSVRSRVQGSTEHFMPTVLRDGTIAYSPPDDPGLALLSPDRTAAVSVAPLGAGSDFVVAESPDAHWLLVRHLDAVTHNDSFAAITRDASRRAVFSDPSMPVEAVDFWRTER